MPKPNGVELKSMVISHNNSEPPPWENRRLGPGDTAYWDGKDYRCSTDGVWYQVSWEPPKSARAGDTCFHDDKMYMFDGEMWYERSMWKQFCVHCGEVEVDFEGQICDPCAREKQTELMKREGVGHTCEYHRHEDGVKCTCPNPRGIPLNPVCVVCGKEGSETATRVHMENPYDNYHSQWFNVCEKGRCRSTLGARPDGYFCQPSTVASYVASHTSDSKVEEQQYLDRIGKRHFDKNAKASIVIPRDLRIMGYTAFGTTLAIVVQHFFL